MAARGQRSRVHTRSASCCPPDYLRQVPAQSENERREWQEALARELPVWWFQWNVYYSVKHLNTLSGEGWCSLGRSGGVALLEEWSSWGKALSCKAMHHSGFAFSSVTVCQRPEPSGSFSLQSPCLSAVTHMMTVMDSYPSRSINSSLSGSFFGQGITSQQQKSKYYRSWYQGIGDWYDRPDCMFSLLFFEECGRLWDVRLGKGLKAGSEA